jgi:hypothetical protein
LTLNFGGAILIRPKEADVFRKIILVLLAFAVLFPSAAHASYLSDMKHDLVRGIKNVVSHPAEIPITIQEYHEAAGYPVVRHLTGLADGIFQAVSRLGSGAWDLIMAAWIPGIQDGLPVQPETLF